MKKISTQTGHISVTGGRVWFRIVGSGPGIPLLTLHGGPGGISDYLEPLTALADERPVILYDQLGCGRSDRPDNPALWVLDRFVEELGQVCAALELPEYHLLGHSWGTILAVEFALNQPAGLTSLILSGPVLSFPRYSHDAEGLKRKLPLEMQAAIERHETAGTTDSLEYQAAFAEWFKRHTSRNPEILERILKLFSDPTSGMNGQVYNLMQGPSEFTITGNLKDWDRTNRVSEIQVPVLFTCGRYDECTPEATAWYHSLMPGSEMVVFENSAHMHHLEEPELYLQTLRNFLRKVESQMHND